MHHIKMFYRVDDAKIISSYYDNENITFHGNIEKINEIMDYFINIS